MSRISVGFNDSGNLIFPVNVKACRLLHVSTQESVPMRLGNGTPSHIQVTDVGFSVGFTIIERG